MIGAPVRRLAPAKVNLFLHVGPVQADGFHPIATWMTFADVGDTLTLEPADAWTFTVDGPFASMIGQGENLVERAARMLFASAGSPFPPFRLTLTKDLPVAAGLGGGSSDAGAALRLLNEALPQPVNSTVLMSIAAELGADGPACLLAEPVIGTGRGDRLSPAPYTPTLHAVLVNPGRPSPTAAVYRAYDGGRPRAADLPALPPGFDSAADLVESLKAARNDLQAAATKLEPSVVEALDLLAVQPETMLARMSGSGATVFGLYARDQDAQVVSQRLRVLRPEWWSAPCTLGTPITNP